MLHTPTPLAQPPHFEMSCCSLLDQYCRWMTNDESPLSAAQTAELVDNICKAHAT
jgi:hypothetical protein